MLRLIAAGWSNQQIADALFISRKTASVHASHIFDKLGAANRVDAAAIARIASASSPARRHPARASRYGAPRFSSWSRSSEIPKWCAISW